MLEDNEIEGNHIAGEEGSDMAKRLREQKYMYQNEFSTALADRLDISKAESDEITGVFLDTLKTAWGQGRTVCFPNFGVFELRIITEKMGRNPKNMKEYMIPESYKPAFRPTKVLREEISQSIQGEAVDIQPQITE